MPKTTSSGTPKAAEMPSTVGRSELMAQRTFAKAHDAAVDTYGEGERAHRVAYAALKHGYEKVGDHWEAKTAKGPSDAQAAGGVDTYRKTAVGVDANATKRHLYELARRLDIHGRSTMDKGELVEAIQRANDRASRRARRS